MISNTTTVFDLNKDIYIKPPSLNQNRKQGKLHIGSVKTGYTKSTLSSIPPKAEKFLLPIDQVKHRFIYSSESNPGVGTYSLSSYSPLQTESNSSKGYGNGFISNDQRFISSYRYVPGPGDYQADKTKTILHQITHSLNGRSLYNAKPTATRREVFNTPGPATYDPNKAYHQANNYFCLGEERFNENIYNTPYPFPGPGEYSPFVIKEEMEKKKKLKSTYDKEPKYNKRDIMKLIDLNTHMNKNDSKFVLRQNDRRKLGKTKNESICSNGNTSSHSNSNRNRKDMSLPSYFQTEIEHIQREANHDIRLSIAKEKELQMIKELLGNGAVPDKMFMYSPRWKHGGHSSKKTPGPAYYNVNLMPNEKLSFNRNISDFLVSSGPLHHSLPFRSLN